MRLSLSCAWVSHLICHILQSKLWPVISVQSTSFWSHPRQGRYLWPYRSFQEAVREVKAAWLTAFIPRTWQVPTGADMLLEAQAYLVACRLRSIAGKM